MVGVAVGSQDLKVVCSEKKLSSEEAPNEIDPADESADDDGDVLVLPYNEQGLQTLLGIADGTVVIAGNRLWAKPLAHALLHNGRNVRYIAPPKGRAGTGTFANQFFERSIIPWRNRKTVLRHKIQGLCRNTIRRCGAAPMGGTCK